MNEGHLRFLASPEWARMLETDLLPWINGSPWLGTGCEPGVVESLPLPERVTAAHERAVGVGFTMSCAPGFGRLLAVLVAAVPEGGRILELGTGVGTGLAWIVEGLHERSDVEVVTVDIDPEIQAVARREAWPAFVQFELADGAEDVGRLGEFDLIFADAPGGKIENLDGAVAALRPCGVFVVDDMDLGLHADPTLREALATVRNELLHHPDLATAEIPVTTGAIVAVKYLR